MRTLLLHLNQWRVHVESPSTRIGECEPETLRSTTEEMDECLAVLIHAEKGDSIRQVELLSRDVKLLADKIGTKRLMISAFAHLSSRGAKPELAISLIQKVIAACKTFEGFEVRSSHFGYNKSLTIDAKGHPAAFSCRVYEPEPTVEIPEKENPFFHRVSGVKSNLALVKIYKNT